MEPPQVQTCHVGSRPGPGGDAVGYCVPFGWSGLFRCLGTQRPGGAACPAGSPFLPRNGEKEGRGQAPWTPGFIARSFPLAGFGGCGALFRSLGYYGAHIRTLIWKLSFAKMLSSIFFLENASQIGLSIPEEIVPLSCQGQRSQKPASGNERLYKMGSRGLPLVFFPPTFFKESRAPPPESAGPPGRCAPRRLRSHPPEGYVGPPLV